MRRAARRDACHRLPRLTLITVSKICGSARAMSMIDVSASALFSNGFVAASRTLQLARRCLHHATLGCYTSVDVARISLLFKRLWRSVGWLGTLPPQPGFKPLNPSPRLLCSQADFRAHLEMIAP
jgi:hypothetical protein